MPSLPVPAVDPLAPSAVGSGLRVAMVIQRFRPDFSGQGIQMEQLCQALVRRGFQPIILSSTRGRPSESESCDGYRVRRLRADLLPGSATRSGLWMPTFGVRVLLELLRLGRIDAVHMHGLNDGLYGAFAFCRLQGAPLIFEMTLMGVDDPSTVLGSDHVLSGARRHAYRRCDAYVAMSRAFVPSYSAAGMPADRLRVIPQGVDTRRFRPLAPEARAAVRAELGCGPNSPLVVFLGSLIERKGIDVLIAAWARVHARRTDARLLLIGRDDFEAQSEERRFLEQQLSRLPDGARTAVHRLGLRDDPERFLGAADVFAFPSRREGFGSAIIEAMACGVPCVVARLAGITDLVFSAPVEAVEPRPGGDGLVVPQDDADAFSTAVGALLDDPRWAAEIGRAGLQQARDRFDLDRVIAPAYARLYADAIERRRS